MLWMSFVLMGNDEQFTFHLSPDSWKQAAQGHLKQDTWGHKPLGHVGCTAVWSTRQARRGLSPRVPSESVAEDGNVLPLLS